MCAQAARNIPCHHQLSISQMINGMYESEGIYAFYSGYCCALLRAFPVHAMVLTTYDMILNLIEN